MQITYAGEKYSREEIMLQPFAGQGNSYSSSYRYGGDLRYALDDGTDGVRSRAKTGFGMAETMKDLIHKAAKKFDLPPPPDGFSFSQESMLVISGCHPEGQSALSLEGAESLPVKELLTSRHQGVCWPVAGLAVRAHVSEGRSSGPGVSGALKYAMPWMDPKPILVILSSIPTLNMTRHEQESGEFRLVKPWFRDLDMVEALESLPEITALRFSNAVLEALVQWDFPLSAEVILRRSAELFRSHPPTEELLQGRMSVLAGVNEDFDAMCPYLMALHGLVSPDKIDLAEADFTGKFSEILVTTAKLLQRQVVSIVGTPLNNVDFSAWFRKNMHQFNEKSPECKYHMPSWTPDGFIVDTVGAMNNPYASNSELLAPMRRFTSGHRARAHSIRPVASAAAVMIGSEVLTVAQRSKYLLAIYEDAGILEKLGETPLPADHKLPKPRLAPADGSVLKAFAAAPVRLANLGAWLSSNAVGLDFRDVPGYQAELPRIIRWRVAEQNTTRARGYDAWVTWLTEEK